MSIVLLIDGYNLIGPVAAPRNFVASHRPDLRGGGSPSWLQVERQRLLDRLSEHLSELVRERTCVVFDAKNAPTNRASETSHSSIQVRYAVDYPEADDLLEELIRTHPVPKHLTAVSSDHRVQSAARRRKATYFDADPWYDDLLDNRVRLGWYPKKKSKSEHQLTQEPQRQDPIDTTSNPSGLEMSDEELRRWIDQRGD